ncbi:hypothetical protein GCM10010326_01140 [Streptomyces xanthochromogenes]|uniref:Uncharacterized protein n=1 Tax=Streptomyces xanthochromogenes TaxID=67384 RepID=A0ABQ2ZDW5_9ACTN|nr:hypothetical protein GCM10010326_01140 [Streptomyces xanthochromogenes]
MSMILDVPKPFTSSVGRLVSAAAVPLSPPTAGRGGSSSLAARAAAQQAGGASPTLARVTQQNATVPTASAFQSSV